jgi:hypothetical protein
MSPTSLPTDTPSEGAKHARKKTDKRPTLTFKGHEFGPEFRALVSKAATRQGMTQAAFVAETLTCESQRILKGAPEEQAAPPVVLNQLFDEQARRLEQISAQVEALSSIQKQTLFERLRSMFTPLSPATASRH